MEISKLWNLNSNDFIKGLVVAGLTAVLTLILEIVKNKGLHLDMADLNQIITVMIISVLGYLLKNLGTDNNGKLLGKSRVK